MPPEPAAPAVIVAARNEADRIERTLDTLAKAFPGAALWVADDGSVDGTGELARAHGARVIGREHPVGKGGNVTAAAEAMLGDGADPGVVLLCDGDLAETAGRLGPLVDAVGAGECDLAVAAFEARVGGGFGIALRFSRWAIERRCGFRATAPISGQRAMRTDVMRAVLPLAPGYGMETGMTIDAVRAGHRVREYELDLAHRATTRNLRGFLHRGRQLRDFVRAYLSRR